MSLANDMSMADQDIVNVYGGGYNAWDVTENDFMKFQKVSYATTLIYVPMVFVIKITLLAVMARVFAPHHRKVEVIYISLFIMLFYYVPALFIKIFFCDPISAYWLGTSNGGRCLDQRKVIIADSVISIATDLWILVLPVPLMWPLHMTTSKKMRVMGILGAGGLATGFSIWRLLIMVVESKTTNTTWFWIHCQRRSRNRANLCLSTCNEPFFQLREKHEKQQRL
ncbi:uncharacterized protein N7482_000006 [Penicillium canariense]|uniref:Rhodopsin domain-containing protein n=1 Tax=Penicillium canariense TaxID=189055 RepID=A0A9W9IAS2_9EURO|nr:uncharacterized protein N7482_000006 [Penicillium canariense]KAJ5174129.1 hypothetical protein N7482_000006 [Penicillium canariense]